MLIMFCLVSVYLKSQNMNYNFFILLFCCSTHVTCIKPQNCLLHFLFFIAAKFKALIAISSSINLFSPFIYFLFFQQFKIVFLSADKIWSNMQFITWSFLFLSWLLCDCFQGQPLKAALHWEFGITCSANEKI